ncbi:hypothetical protein FJZ19_02150 [Candidatus Pacearchaeota archaeon]|nr:hypothetical protein [Candidatus Pacearchaeota archaeon]
MRIGIIGPSKIEYVEEINPEARKIIAETAKITAKSNNEIAITPDKGSVSEFFAQEFIKNKGKKVWEVLQRKRNQREKDGEVLVISVPFSTSF